MATERIEFIEQRLSDNVLLKVWPQHLEDLESQLQTVKSIQDLTDLIWSAGLRGAIAVRRKNINPDFEPWRNKWVQLKCRALVQVLQMRLEDDSAILVTLRSSEESNNNSNQLPPWLVFRIQTKFHPEKFFIINVRFDDMTQILPEPNLFKLIGTYDMFKVPSKKPRSLDRFNENM